MLVIQWKKILLITVYCFTTPLVGLNQVFAEQTAVNSPLTHSLLAKQSNINSTSNNHQNIILVYGDSLSTAYGLPKNAGWVSLLRETLSKQYPSWQVVNLSMSGQTTGGALPKLAAHLKTHQPKHMILELGGNDGLRGIPLAIIKKNLNKMIEVGKENQVRTILLGMNLPPNYGPAYSNKFHQIYHDLANLHSLLWIQSFLAPLAKHPNLFQADGIHPKAEAQPLLLKHIWPLIEQAIKNTQH